MPPSPLDTATDASPASDAPTRHPVGQLWSLDVSSLDPRRLAGEDGRARLAALFDELVDALDLHPVAPATWHVFPGPHAGVTGLLALSESHLSCHSFPEHAGVTIDLYTCRTRPAPDWADLVRRHLARPGTDPVLDVRTLTRSFR